MTLVEPGVDLTACATAPFESSWTEALVASVAPPSTIFLNVARVPEPSGRMIKTTGSLGPPTALQLVSWPVHRAVAWALVRFVTPPAAGAELPAAGADVPGAALEVPAGVGVAELPPHAPTMKAVEIARPAIVLPYFTRCFPPTG